MGNMLPRLTLLQNFMRIMTSRTMVLCRIIVLRQEFPIKRMQLTPISVKFPFNAPTRIVRKELEANKVNEQWEQSTWKKRMVVKAKRAGLTDLDRFKLRKAKSARNKILAKALNAKKKTLRKAGKL